MPSVACVAASPDMHAVGAGARRLPEREAYGLTCMIQINQRCAVYKKKNLRPAGQTGHRTYTSVPKRIIRQFTVQYPGDPGNKRR